MARTPGAPCSMPSANGASSSSAAAWPSSAPRTTGRCCTRRSSAKTTCRNLMSRHEDLARPLLDDAEAERCDMDQRLFEELTSLRELHERRELERAKRALEEKDRQKDEFIAILAHELRNPLGTIRASADALRLMELQDPRVVQLTERLDRQTVAMARMLEDLLDASRIALGKTSVQLERVDLRELLARGRGRATAWRRAGWAPAAHADGRPAVRRASRPRAAPPDRRQPPVERDQVHSSRAAPSSSRWGRKTATPSSGSGTPESDSTRDSRGSCSSPSRSRNRGATGRRAGLAWASLLPAAWPRSKVGRSRRRATGSTRGPCSPSRSRWPAPQATLNGRTHRRRIPAPGASSSWRTTRTRARASWTCSC